MSIAPITGQSIFSTPSVSAGTTAPPFDPAADDSDDPAAALGSLTANGTGPLDSQTLQALLDLTQGSGAQSQTQGAHGHHRHHKGLPPQQQDSSAAPAAGSEAAVDTASAAATEPSA